MIHNKSRFLLICIFLSILLVSFFFTTGNNVFLPLHISNKIVSEAYAVEESSYASESEHGNAGDHSGHTDPFSYILLELTILIVAAIVGRWGAGKLNQPAVVGELLIGVLIGNVLYWMDSPFAFLIMHVDSAKEIIHITWQTGVSTLDAARQVFSPEHMVPGAIGHKLLGIISGTHAQRYILTETAVWIFSYTSSRIWLHLDNGNGSINHLGYIIIHKRVGVNALLVAIIQVLNAPFATGRDSGHTPFT